MRKASLLAGSALALFALVGGGLAIDGASAAGNSSKYEIRDTRGADGQGKWANDAAFVIIGSFQTMDRAQRLAAQREDWGCKILKAEVKGRTQYRVAFGPFPKEVMKSAVSRASKAGISDAWLLPAKYVGGQAKASGTAGSAG